MNTLPVPAPASPLGQALPHDVGALLARVHHYESELAERDAAIAKHDTEIAQRDARIEHLQEQIRLLLARRFAPSSEKLPDGQLGLFNEAEASAAQDCESAPGTEVAAHRRATPKRAPLPDALPRIDVEHPLPDHERTCPHHGVELERFGEVTSEQLDIIPAQVRVLRHVRGKYRCPHCEGHLRTAPMPAQPLPKSLASPGLLAHVATAKYADALPLYRQHQQLKRIGVDLSRTTLATWMVRAGALVVPLLNLLRDELLDRPYLLMDETTVQVLKEPGKAAQSKSQLWAQMSAGPDPPIVLFEYDPTRSGDVPKRLLAGFTGALHTDGYSGYAPVVRDQGLVHLACWAHARRGFTDTLKSLGLNPNKLPPNPPPKARRALSALRRIQTLYAIERRIRDLPPDQRLRTRQAESVPVLDALRAWLDHTRPKVLPSAPLGKALHYLHNQWNALTRFCDDGRYGIDTNPVENAIRPFCLGRRNWLFSDTVPGANASARLYSLIETAKANSLEPYAYLRHVFTELPKAQSLPKVEALLPTRLDPAALTRYSPQGPIINPRQ